MSVTVVVSEVSDLFSVELPVFSEQDDIAAAVNNTANKHDNIFFMKNPP
jgi:hypothetical protein